MSKKFQISILFFLSLGVLIGCKDSVKEDVLTKAVYKGEKDMSWAIAHYVEYPVSEMEVNRAGIVKVSFQVDEEGKVNKVKAILNDEEIIAEVGIARKKIVDKEILPINLPVLQSLIGSVEQLNFEPAKKNGKPINSTIETSVEFILIE